MKRIKLFLLKISLLIVVFLFSFWLFWELYDRNELKKEKEISYSLSAKEKQLINDGDIILRRGFGFVSDYIVKKFDEKYKISHCGIICKKNDSLSVIHSESSSYLSFEGVQMQDFDQYVEASHKNSVLIVRFNKCKSSELKQISKRGKYYLSTKVAFDYSFDMNDSSKMYCAEIIWHVIKDEFNTDIYYFPEREINYSQFSNFWDSTYFDVIINHQNK